MNQQTEYILVVQTNQYAGNFERDMCAYMTGLIGDCEVGEERAALYEADGLSPLNELVNRYRADERGCCRPVAIFAGGGDNKSFGIFLHCEPNEEEWEILKKRALAFAGDKRKKNRFVDYDNLKVLGMRLVRKVTRLEVAEEIVL